MKTTIILMSSLLMMSSVLAGEVDTDCPAMNENREKIIKPVQDHIKQATKSVQQ